MHVPIISSCFLVWCCWQWIQIHTTCHVHSQLVPVHCTYSPTHAHIHSATKYCPYIAGVFVVATFEAFRFWCRGGNSALWKQVVASHVIVKLSQIFSCEYYELSDPIPLLFDLYQPFCIVLLVHTHHSNAPIIIITMLCSSPLTCDIYTVTMVTSNTNGHHGNIPTLVLHQVSC